MIINLAESILDTLAENMPDTSDPNVIACAIRLQSIGSSAWPCTFSRLKKDLLVELYWLSEYCLHHVNQLFNSQENYSFRRHLRLMNYYNRLNDIAIVYYALQGSNQVADSEVTSRIRKAKLALMTLDLDCETDIALAKVLSSGIEISTSVVSNKGYSDPWD